MVSAYIFDAYGTLFDVHAAIARYRAAAGIDADRFSEIWRTKQLEYTWTLTLAGHYADFWTLTERALDFAFARVPSVDRRLRPKLLDAYLTLDAFPDTRTTLAALRAQGLRLGILSNGTPRMLAAAVEAAGIAEHLDAVRCLKFTRLPPTPLSCSDPTWASYRRTAGTSWAPRHSASKPIGSIAPACRTSIRTFHRCAGSAILRLCRLPDSSGLELKSPVARKPRGTSSAG
jgi:2-haloalkanoic acid dehalogenase type II